MLSVMEYFTYTDVGREGGVLCTSKWRGRGEGGINPLSHLRLPFLGLETETIGRKVRLAYTAPYARV